MLGRGRVGDRNKELEDKEEGMSQRTAAEASKIRGDGVQRKYLSKPSGIRVAKT